MSFIYIDADYISISKRTGVYGVGINDAKYLTNIEVKGKKYVCPIYSKWKSILLSCFSDDKYSVCVEWNLFTNFKKWIETKDHDNKCINTIISGIDPYVFSAENCVFVDRWVSNLLNSRKNDRGKLPIGICKEYNKYRAYISIKGKRLHLGMFDSVLLAKKAYAQKKYEVIVEAANNQECIKTKKGLILWAEKFKKSDIN